MKRDVKHFLERGGSNKGFCYGCRRSDVSELEDCPVLVDLAEQDEAAHHARVQALRDILDRLSDSEKLVLAYFFRFGWLDIIDYTRAEASNE